MRTIGYLIAVAGIPALCASAFNDRLQQAVVGLLAFVLVKMAFATGEQNEK